jgi:hypothetical protein
MPSFVPPMNSNIWPPQASLAIPPASEVIIIDDSGNIQHVDTSIITGRVEPKCCRIPNMRVVARAILNTKGPVHVYVCSKYSKRVVKKPNVKIGIEDVDASQDFEKVLPEKRLTAIRHRLQEKLGIKREPHPTNASKATPSPEKAVKSVRSGHNILADDKGSIIGRAMPDFCHGPEKPPMIRARSIVSVLLSLSFLWKIL